MNVSRFIANRLELKTKDSYSSFITNIASIAVAISLAVMILTICISRGYDKNIQNKLFGFWGHVNVSDASSSLGLEAKPISMDSLFTEPIHEKWVQSVNYFAYKAGLLKTDQAIHGIVLKGVRDDFDWSRFSEFLVDGEFPSSENEALISKVLAKKMELSTGDKIRIFFIQKPMRARALTISGLYNTNMVELDEQIVFSSIHHIQKLNQWRPDQVEGAEIYVDNPENSIQYANVIRENYTTYDKQVSSIRESNPEIFDWLNWLKTNQWIILILMALVAIVNMVSMLLVMILERSKMIGVLKAIGSPYRIIRDIFLQKALFIISRGLFWGNLIGLLLAFIQLKFQIIQLDPEMYFLSSVPIDIQLKSIVLVNLATLLVVFFSLFIPSLYIKKINPIQALRFD